MPTARMRKLRLGVHQRLDAGRLSRKSVAGLSWNSGLFPAKCSTSDKSICFWLFICLLYSVLFWWEAGAGPEEWRALALCSRGGRESLSQASGPGSSPLCPSRPGARPGSPLGCKQALPYLQTPVICTPICGQMASRLAPGHPRWEGAPPLRSLSGNLGWSPRWGVSQWRRHNPVPPLGLSTPE